MSCKKPSESHLKTISDGGFSVREYRFDNKRLRRIYIISHERRCSSERSTNHGHWKPRIALTKKCDACRSIHGFKMPHRNVLAGALSIGLEIDARRVVALIPEEPSPICHTAPVRSDSM